MLQIYVYGPRENGFLELPGDTQLDMEQLQPQFDEDLSTGEFSIPFDIPWNDHNRRLLGYPERITNFNYSANFYACDVYDNGVPEMQRAKLTLLGKAGRWTYDRGTWNASVSGTKGLFGAAIKNKSLKDVFYGPVITWTDMDSRAFAKEVVSYNNTEEEGGSASRYPYLRFAPVAIENYIDKDRTDFTSEFLTKDTVNNIVADAGTGSWVFGSPKPANPNQATTPADAEYLHHRTVPFLTVQFVVKKIFEHFGYSITGDWIDDIAFKNLLLFNNYAIESYNTTSRQDTNRSINLRNHLPDRGVNVFLKALFGFFGLYMVFEDNNTVRITYFKTMLKNRKIAKLDEYLVNSFEATYEGGESQQGYKLSYAWDETEGYHNDRVKEINLSQVVVSVWSSAELGDLDIGRPLTTDDVAYVASENMYFKLANATTNPKRWDCWAEKLGDYTEGAGDQSYDFGISPLPVYAVANPITGLIERRNYVGTRQKGSYLNYRGVRVQNPFGLFLFYGAVVSIAPPLFHPASFTAPWYKTNEGDALDQRGALYSLAWHGTNGMAVNFHQAWKNVTRNKEVVVATLLANRKLEYILRTHNHFETNGVLFLLKQINKQIPMQQTVEALLVAADTQSDYTQQGGYDSVDGGGSGIGEGDLCKAVIDGLKFTKTESSVLISWQLVSGAALSYKVITLADTITVSETSATILLANGESVTIIPICQINGAPIDGSGITGIYSDIACGISITELTFVKLAGSAVRIGWFYSGGTPAQLIVQSPDRTETLAGGVTSTVHTLNEDDEVTVTPVCSSGSSYASGTARTESYIIPVCNTTIGDVELTLLDGGLVKISWVNATGSAPKYKVSSPNKTEFVSTSPTAHFLNDGDQVTITPVCSIDGQDVEGVAKTVTYEVPAEP